MRSFGAAHASSDSFAHELRMHSLMCMQTRHGHQLSQMVSELPTVERVAEELLSGLSFKYSS